MRPDLSFPFCSGILPICPRIFRICPFHLSWPVRSTHEDQSRKGPRHTQDLSPQKWEPLIKEIPESEIQAKFFADTGEKRSEILAKHFADSRPLISRKSGRKKLHEKPSTFSTREETKFFHSEILGVGGPKKPPGLENPRFTFSQFGHLKSNFRDLFLRWARCRDSHRGFASTSDLIGATRFGIRITSVPSRSYVGGV